MVERDQLRMLSARVGADPLLVQAAGGNTSLKDEGVMWIKASGTCLKDAQAKDIFVPLDHAAIMTALAANDPACESCVTFVRTGLNSTGLRPSIETTVHALMPQRVVVHVHCVNTIAWAIRADAGQRLSEKLQGFAWAFIPYARPGLPLAGAIAALANFAMFFGGGDDRERPGGIIGTLALMILAPMAAGLVQMAISRGREYEADRVGAEIAGDPQALASALQKIDSHARRIVNTTAERNPASGQLFIINPLAGRGADNLFSTHPATGNRVKALMELGLKMGVAPRPAFGTEAPKGPVSTSVPTTPVSAPPRASGPWG